MVLVMLVVGGGCATHTPPTPTTPPTITPRALAVIVPTRTPRPLATPNATPIVIPATQTPVQPSGATDTPPPLVFTPRPPETRLPAAGRISRIGESVGGREIIAQTFGGGAQRVLLVGGIHGGWEANTVELMRQLGDHLATRPTAVLPGLSVMLIPNMNPDGTARGSGEGARFNGNGVDLNRNWACGWSADAVWRNQAVDPGRAPLSEPETQAVAAVIQTMQPAAVIFYHSAADGVFAGNCPRRIGEWRSGRLEAIYGEAAGYSYGRAFSAYPVTGTAPSWVDGLGIAAVDVELSSARDPQFERNLRAVMAVQCWVLGIAAERLRACD